MSALSLEVSGLRHRYRGLDRDTPGETCFRIPAGGRALLVGPNGAGKTTLLLRLVGLLHGPGEVRVGGERLDRRSARRLRRRIGLLWQNPEDGLLLPRVLEDVCLGPVNDGVPAPRARESARAWLERLGIASLAEREVRHLSRGEKGLVALAGLLVREPGLLLLDEPTAALDARARERLLGILAGLPATLLVVTHQPEAWGDGWSRVAPGAGVIRASPGRGSSSGGTPR